MSLAESGRETCRLSNFNTSGLAPPTRPSTMLQADYKHDQNRRQYKQSSDNLA